MKNFPQEEIEKRDALGALLKELYALCKRMDIEEYYGRRFSTIAFMASKKLVGCNTRIRLAEETKEHYDYSTSKYVKVKQAQWELRRDGLVQQFGYHGERFKDILKDNPVNAIFYFLYDYDGKVNPEGARVIAELKELLTDTTKKNQIQSPEALERFIQALEDIKATKLNGRSNNGYAIAKKVVLKAELPSALDWKGDFSADTSTTLISLRIEVNANNYKILADEVGNVEIELKEQGSYNSEHAGELPWTDYIRISEEPIYSALVSLLKDTIKHGNEQLEKNTKILEDVCNKYGEYLVLAEM